MLNQKYPKLFCAIIASSGNQDVQHTVTSLLSQNYPSTQLQFRIFGEGEPVSEMALAMNNSDASYFVVLQAGDSIFDDALQSINLIFQRYADINWLTGIQTLQTKQQFQVNMGNMANRRWNRLIFEKNLYKNSGRYIAPASTFFKRYLWDIAQPHLNIVSKESFCNDLWQAFFKVQNLYATDIYLSSAPVKQTRQLRNRERVTLIEDSWKNKLVEFLYIQNIPFLRSYYKVKNELPPVIRYDFKTKSYWLSDY